MGVYNIASVLTILLLVIGALTVIVTSWLTAVGLFPQFVRQCQHAYAQPFRAVLWGLLGAVVVFIGAAISQAPPPLKILGLLIITFPIVLALIGSAGLARRVGAGLESAIDREQPWRRTLRGGIALVFPMLLPIIGWFILLPFVLLSGCGVALRTLITQRRGSAKAAAAPPPVQPESAPSEDVPATAAAENEAAL